MTLSGLYFMRSSIQIPMLQQKLTGNAIANHSSQLGVVPLSAMTAIAKMF